MNIFKKIIDYVKRLRNRGYYSLSTDSSVKLKSLNLPNPEVGSYWKLETKFKSCYEVIGYNKKRKLVSVIDINSGKELIIPLHLFEGLFFEISKFKPQIYTRDTF